MFSLQEFIDRCQANDARAWVDLCTIVESASRYRIQRLLRENRFDKTYDDDVLQELYRQMRASRCRRLSVFRGTTYPELHAFMGEVACRFAKKLIARWCRKRKKEEEALRRAGLPARDGPTDQQIAKLHRELLSVMPLVDQQKLYHLWQNAFGGVPGEPGSVREGTAIPKRTLRRWRLELRRKYADWL